MMKNYRIFSFTCLICLCLFTHDASSQEPTTKVKTFSLSGLSQINQGVIALEYFDGNKPRYDTVDLRNGKFFFKGPLIEISQAALSILDSRAPSKKNKLKEIKKYYFILLPMPLTIKLDTANALPIVGGSRDQEDLYKLDLKKLDITKETSLLYDQMMAMIYKQLDGDTSKSLDREISLKSAALAASQKASMEKVLKLNLGFIDTHRGSILSAFLIEEHRRFMQIDSVEIIYNKLTKDIKNSLLGKKLQARITAVKNSQVNMPAPDFTAEDIDGKIVRLSDFAGNYVLLDFWASWCVPCREVTPEVQEIYQLFSPRLKIVYISLDTKKDAWEKAIREDNIGGKVNLWVKRTGMQKESDITYIYNVQPIPAFVLIDDKGKIIYRGESTSAPAEVKKILESNLK